MDIEDVRMLKYFYFDKGDMTRWSDFEKFMRTCRVESPHIAKVIDDFITQQKLLEFTLKNLEYET